MVFTVIFFHPHKTHFESVPFTLGLCMVFTVIFFHPHKTSFESLPITLRLCMVFLLSSSTPTLKNRISIFCCLKYIYPWNIYFYRENTYFLCNFLVVIYIGCIQLCVLLLILMLLISLFNIIKVKSRLQPSLY